jgi:hypothetical protein
MKQMIICALQVEMLLYKYLILFSSNSLKNIKVDLRIVPRKRKMRMMMFRCREVRMKRILPWKVLP